MLLLLVMCLFSRDYIKMLNHTINDKCTKKEDLFVIQAFRSVLPEIYLVAAVVFVAVALAAAAAEPAELVVVGKSL